MQNHKIASAITVAFFTVATFSGCEPVSSVSAIQSDTNEAKIEKLNNELSESKSRLEELAAKLVGVREELQQARTENEKLTANLELIRARFAEMNNNFQAVKSEMNQIDALFEPEDLESESGSAGDKVETNDDTEPEQEAGDSKPDTKSESGSNDSG